MLIILCSHVWKNDCPYVSRGMSEEEILADCLKHAEEFHAEEFISVKSRWNGKQVVDMIKTAIENG